MSQFEAADNTVLNTAMSAYVPSLQRTEGQAPPIAAHGGLSYMSFDQNGDAGTAVAIQDALTEIAEGEGQRVVDKAPPGPIKTKWASRSATSTSAWPTSAPRTASKPLQAV